MISSLYFFFCQFSRTATDTSSGSGISHPHSTVKSASVFFRFVCISLVSTVKFTQCQCVYLFCFHSLLHINFCSSFAQVRFGFSFVQRCEGILLFALLRSVWLHVSDKAFHFMLVQLLNKRRNSLSVVWLRAAACAALTFHQKCQPCVHFLCVVEKQ